jgi:FkbM family methyltransferase
MSILRALLWPLRNRRGVNPAPASATAPQPSSLTPKQYEQLTPILRVGDGATEVLYAATNPFTQWRVETLFVKEPDTIEWIASFGPEDVLADIGANVGMYTVWAAKTRGTRVFAFEPESQNFAQLYRNIVLNNLSGRVTAYCLALSDEAGYSLLRLSGFGTGGSGHTYGADLDHQLKPRASRYLQGCVSTTLDRLVAEGVMPAPTHIKIDVDGLEHKVLTGCRETLRDARLKTILLEINSNLEEHRRLVDELGALGFSFSEQQVLAARRTKGSSAGTGNYVFRR